LILPQLDLDDGFVHTSSALQTADTLRLFFKDIEGVWILKINAERLANWRKIDWVQGSGVDTNEKGTSFSLLFSSLSSLLFLAIKGRDIDTIFESGS
jgi:uncharacterized protein (DUF952 family)